MATNQEEGSDSWQLLEALNRVMKQSQSFVNSSSLSCAIRLGIFEAIHQHGEPITVSELANILHINPQKVRGINSLMRILVHHGLATKLEEEDTSTTRYTLTPASRLLLKHETYSVSGCGLLSDIHALAKMPWDSASDWFFNNDATAFETAHGKSLWELSASDPGFSGPFHSAIAGEAKLMSDVIVKECKDVFEGLTSLVDVGGGTGSIAKAIALTFPELKCTCYDLPHVVADLQGTENLEFVGGDMFQNIPPANALLLKAILHTWNDEECVKILKKCREAIPSKDKGGKVIIIDMIMDSQDDNKEIAEVQILFDLTMMVLFAANERNLKEWSKLFSEAGFSDYKIIRKLGSKSLIEIYP